MDGGKMAVILSVFLAVFFQGCDGKGSTDLYKKLWPTNKAAILGSMVTFDCRLTSGGTVRWSICDTKDPTSCETISVGTVIVTDNQDGKYTISQRPEGEYRLQINDVGVLDAKKYKCHICSACETGIFSELVVLAETIHCGTNTSMETLVEGQLSTITCSVGFSGRWAPSMRCRIHQDDWLYLQENSTRNQAVHNVQFRPVDTMNGERINCKAFYDFPKTWEVLSEDEATNKPNLTNVKWTSLPLNILHPPHNVTITPRDAVFEVGQMVTCNAVSNPLSTYEWYDVITNDKLGEGPELDFIDSHLGILRMRCVATTTIEDKIYTQSIIKEVLVCNPESSCFTIHNKVTMVGAILGTLLGLSFIANILLVFGSRGFKPFWKIKSHKGKRQEEVKQEIAKQFGEMSAQRTNQISEFQRGEFPLPSIPGTLRKPGEKDDGYHCIDDVTKCSTMRSIASESGCYSMQPDTSSYEPITVARPPTNQRRGSVPVINTAPPSFSAVANQRRASVAAMNRDPERQQMSKQQRMNSSINREGRLIHRDNSVSTYSLEIVENAEYISDNVLSRNLRGQIHRFEFGDESFSVS